MIDPASEYAWPVGPVPTTEALFAALTALRDAESPFAPSQDRHWDVVDAWLRATDPPRNADDEDAIQETLIAVGRRVHAMEADVAAQAARWIATIHRHKRTDGARARRADPLDRGLDRATDEETSPRIDRLEGEGAGTFGADALERIIDAVEAAVEAYLAAAEPLAHKRHLRRLQAGVALRRILCDADARELAAFAGEAGELGRDRIYKWVERGRPVLLAALDRWLEDRSMAWATRSVVEGIRSRIEARRADAGKPRPGRRRGETS